MTYSIETDKDVRDISRGDRKGIDVRVDRKP